jgi:hypothetical protein
MAAEAQEVSVTVSGLSAWGRQDDGWAWYCHPEHEKADLKVEYDSNPAR